MFKQKLVNSREPFWARDGWEVKGFTIHLSGRVFGRVFGTW
jgi:hypothetical protein